MKQHWLLNCRWKMQTYPRPVRRLPVLFIIVPHFVEVVLVKLSHKTRKVAVFEVLGKDMLGELFVLCAG
jgi:hypothetical protein